MIGLADGVYDGTFTAAGSGTAAAPIWMCGGRAAVLRGPGTDEGFVLHLEQVRHWRLVGFTVREGQKGVMADGTGDTVIQDLTVTRSATRRSTCARTAPTTWCAGSPSPTPAYAASKFGEGVYVGSAVSNWCEITACEPDRSDRNVVVANTISRTAAESVDIKEGTTGGVLADNTFDGAGMRGRRPTPGWTSRATAGSSRPTTAPPPAVGLRGQPPGRRLGHRQHLRRQHRRRRRPRLRLRAPPADRRPRRAQPRHLHQHRDRRRRRPHQQSPAADRRHGRSSSNRPREKPMKTTTAQPPHATAYRRELTVGVVGLGYLGAVHAAGMAALGHRVVGYDVDPRKVDALSRAHAPFFEPGLEELLARTQGEDLVSPTT